MTQNPASSMIIAPPRRDELGNWMEPLVIDPNWTHYQGSDDKLWSRDEWKKHFEEQAKWNSRTWNDATPEDSNADPSNTWEGLPWIKIQQREKTDVKGTSTTPTTRLAAT